MSRLYSARFISIQGLNGTSPTVTVPPGHTYVVKQLTMYSAPTLGVVRGWFEDVQGGANVALFSAATQALAPEWFGFFGTLVFPEGTAFRWRTQTVLTDAADVGAFGYDFVN